MQSFSSRIWTRVAVSISYDDNHYTTGTSSSVKDANHWMAYHGEFDYSDKFASKQTIFFDELITDEWYTSAAKGSLSDDSQVLNSEFFLLVC